MSWPQPKFKESNATTAARCSLPLPSCPIPGVNTPYLLTEDWQQLLVDSSSWTPLALNTAHPEYAGFVLVDENEPVDVGGGMVRWRRTYAKVPATHNEFENFSYNFPGSADAILNQSPNSRTDVVLSRLQHDYFLVGAGGAYATPGSIPLSFATLFCMVGVVGANNVGAPWVKTNYVSNGITIRGVLFMPTTPSFTEYQGCIKDALANGWNASITSQSVLYDATNQLEYIPLTGGSAPVYKGQFIAENSRLTRWKGNIWLRTTRFVLAI